jgi:hypothetical protein
VGEHNETPGEFIYEYTLRSTQVGEYRVPTRTVCARREPSVERMHAQCAGQHKSVANNGTAVEG